MANTDHIAVQKLCRLLTLDQQIADCEDEIDTNQRAIAACREERERVLRDLSTVMIDTLPELAEAMRR